MMRRKKFSAAAKRFGQAGGFCLKYAVVDRGDEHSRHLAEQFRRWGATIGLEESTNSPDIVLSIGGDGTLLQAFHLYVDQLDRVAFVGVHTGHLGFFADWKPEELEQLALLMGEGPEQSKLKIVQYPLAEIEFTTTHGKEKHLVLNEFTLKGHQETLVAQVHINDEPFETFRGDGICVSAPTGSTAYNKSLGGAIIHPSIESVQIAEIASINNRVYRTLGSSLLMPKHHHCDIYPRTRGGELLISIDHLYAHRTDIVSIRCWVSEQKVRFARFRSFPFWNRVRDAFIGEV